MRQATRVSVGALVCAVGLMAYLPGCGSELEVEGFEEEQTSTTPLKSCTSGNQIRIVPRAQWGARSARSTRPAHTPNRITIHHTVQGNISGPAAVRQVQSQHMDGNGWADVGYHFLVDRDGTIYQGAVENRIGSHVSRQNTGNLGIAMIGSFHVETLGAEQQRAVSNLVHHLATKYRIPIDRSRVKGHKERLATICPGSVDLNAIVRDAAAGLVCGGGSAAPAPAPVTPALDAIEVYWARLGDGSYKLHALTGSRTTRVEYYVDDWRIAESTRQQGSNFPANYRFSSERPERFFEVRGFDASGKQVSRGIGLIDVTDGVGVYIRQMGRDVFEVGLERAPDGVAGMEVTVDGRFVLTDSVTGQKRSARRAVRSRYSGISERDFTLTTYNADGSLRGNLRRTFDLRGQ